MLYIDPKALRLRLARACPKRVAEENENEFPISNKEYPISKVRREISPRTDIGMTSQSLHISHDVRLEIRWLRLSPLRSGCWLLDIEFFPLFG
jgi:hypothetical protein